MRVRLQNNTAAPPKTVTGLIRGRWAYIDKLQMWLAVPLSADQISALEERLGARRWLHVQNRPMRYQRQWKQRLQIGQPDDRVIRWLARTIRGAYMVNYIELALDLTTDSPADNNRLRAFLDRHLLHRWHGRQQVQLFRGTFYSGQRGARRRLACYSDQWSKQTGEVHAVHVEWRFSTAVACRRFGVSSLRQLVGFDHRQFWAKHLRLASVDLEQLGRAAKRTRRLGPMRSTGTHSMFHSIGRLIARNSAPTNERGEPEAWTVQSLIDAVPFDLRRAVTPLINASFLPDTP